MMEGNFTLMDIQAMNHESLLDSLVIAAQSAEAAKIARKMSETIEKYENDTDNMTVVLLSRLPTRNASWVRQMVEAARDLAITKKTEGHSQKAIALEKFIEEKSNKLLDRMKKFSRDHPDTNGLIRGLTPVQITRYNEIEAAIINIRHQSENPNPDNSRRRMPFTI